MRNRSPSQSKDAPLEKLRGRGLDFEAADFSEDSCQAEERLPAQVPDTEVLGKHEVPIHLNQRVEVEETADAAHRGDDQECPRGQGSLGHEAPPEDSEAPDEELEESAGEEHPETLALPAEQIRIAHVAVEAGKEVEEQEAHVGDPSSEMPACQGVGHLVQHRDRRYRHQDEEESLEAHDAFETEGQLFPVQEEDPECDQERQAREPDERLRETPSKTWIQPVDQRVGIGEGELPVEDAPRGSALERRGILFPAAQKTEPAELVGEPREDFLRDEDVSLLRRPAADDLERGLPVELGDEEVLERLHPEVAVRARVLDDEIGRALFLHRRDDQVGAKLELGPFPGGLRAEGVTAGAAAGERTSGIDR